MFEFLKRLTNGSSQLHSSSASLSFKDGTAALEYACQFLECPLTEGATLPAVVLNAQELVGTNEPVQKRKDGTQVAMLRIASRDGGFVVLASTAGPNGPQLQPGDLVAWRAASHSVEVAAAISDKDTRCGWVGLILGTLRPEHKSGSWVGHQRFSS